MPDISELKKWCDEARKILGRTGKDSRGKMEDRNAEVAKMLVRLKAIPSFLDEYNELFSEYESITAHAVKASSEGDKAAVAAASRDLSLLKNKLRMQLAQDPGASKGTKKAGDKAEDKLDTPRMKGWASDKEARDKEEEAARLEPLAAPVSGDPLMTQVPVDANAQEILAAGLAAARLAVTQALKARDTRTQDDVDVATGLLGPVRIAIQAAEAAARTRLDLERREKDRLDQLALVVSGDALMSQVPQDANAQEILAAGLDAARSAVTLALKTRDSRVEGDVNTARGLLDAVRQAIQAAEAAARERLEKDRLEQLASVVSGDALMTRVPANANDQELIDSGVVSTRAAVTQALKTRDTRVEGDIGIARGLLDAVRPAIQAAETAAARRLEVARLKLLADAVANDPLMTQVPAAANAEEILAAGLAARRLAVTSALKTDDTRTESDVSTARSLLGAVQLAITAAEAAAAKRLAEAAYNQRYSEIFATLSLAWSVKGKRGVPQKAKSDLEKAYNEADALKKLGSWGPAKDKLDEIDTAAQVIVTLYNAGKSYFDAMDGIDPELQAAVKVYLLKAQKLAVLSAALDSTFGKTMEAAAKPDWPAALLSVAPLKAACIALRDAGAVALSEQPAFDLAYKSVTNLPTARGIAKAPPASLKNAEAKVFGEKLEAVESARNSGDFAVARLAIAALQLAIDQLILANEGVKAKKLLFEQEMAKIAGYAEARDLALANSPAVTARIPAFTLADGNVDAKVKLQDWDAAKGLVDALAAATRELLLAKASFNSGFSTVQQGEFKQKMTDLKPRTDPAASPGPTEHITALRKVVAALVTQIGTAVSGSDYASAAMLHAQLLPALARMDTAENEYKAHLLTFNAARNGAVKLAREFVLTPPKLADERTAALLATEDRIKHFANKGSITGKADPMVATWIEQANAWKAAQAASDNLNSGVDPDSSLMRTLAAMPGGGEVLDALMAGLPEGKPEKFLREAIKVRFGVEVKQFEKKNARVTDFSGLTPISADAPDKSLKKMYEVFCKVPLKNVKGKIDELIHFDEDAHGAAAGGKKVYMYCGRANDPKGSKQKFGEGVLPDGEEIEEDFQPATGAGIPDELPYFDFAAMHEVGHAVDEAEGIMSSQPPGQIAGWLKHTTAEVAAKAAARFKYNVDYIRLTLNSPDSTPPSTVYPPEGSVTQPVWDKARDEALNWCKSVRVGMSLWNNPALSKHVAIDGRVYQEAYDGDWVSYQLAARSKGITSYQFRSPAEWFAELYAAYFSGKLKKNHPYASWLKPLKKIA